MTDAAYVMAHAGHWATWLLYGLPALIGGALWWNSGRRGGDEDWSEDPRMADSDTDA